MLFRSSLLEQIDGAFQPLESFSLSKLLGKSERTRTEDETKDDGEDGIFHASGYENAPVRDKPIQPDRLRLVRVRARECLLAKEFPLALFYLPDRRGPTTAPGIERVAIGELAVVKGELEFHCV